MEEDFADQYAKFEEGEFKMSTEEFISGSWQGDALQVGSCAHLLALKLSGNNGFNNALTCTHHLQAVVTPQRTKHPVQEPTGLPKGTLRWVGEALCRVPPGFNLNPHVATILDSRRCTLSSLLTGCFNGTISRVLIRCASDTDLIPSYC